VCADAASAADSRLSVFDAALRASAAGARRSELAEVDVLGAAACAALEAVWRSELPECEALRDGVRDGGGGGASAPLGLHEVHSSQFAAMYRGTWTAWQHDA
jgi:hypothetical protein